MAEKDPARPAAESQGKDPDAPQPAQAAAPALQPPPWEEARPRRDRRARPDLQAVREPLFRDLAGYRLRLDTANLAKLRELPGSRGKSDKQLGEEFLDGQADHLVAALSGEVVAPADVRVVIDPFTRQAFLAVENRVRGIVSF